MHNCTYNFTLLLTIYVLNINTFMLKKYVFWVLNKFDKSYRNVKLPYSLFPIVFHIVGSWSFLERFRTFWAIAISFDRKLGLMVSGSSSITSIFNGIGVATNNQNTNVKHASTILSNEYASLYYETNMSICGLRHVIVIRT